MSAVLIDAPATTPAGKLLPVEEVAAMLGISVRSVYRLTDAAVIPGAVRVGGSRRWLRDRLESWLRDGCPKGVTK